MRLDFKNTKIESLQALRGIAFLGIFLSHALAPIEWAAISVSVFFALSGFLLTNRYYEQESMSCNLKANFHFAWKRIKPLYPLHLVMMVAAIILQAFPDPWKYILNQGKSIVLNIFLLQSWYPNKAVNVSLNGVSWFLSTVIFFYFIFPILIRLIRKLSIRKHIVVFILLLFIQVLSCYFLLIKGVKSDIYEWFMYHFPLFRIPDFYLGCIFAKIFVSYGKMEKNPKYYIFYIIEIAVLVLTISVYIWSVSSHSSVLLKGLNNATTIYTIPAGLWVVLFAYRKGIITRLLSNRCFAFLGNISGYAFLTHLMIIQSFDHFCYYIHITPREKNNLVVVILCFVITVAISYGLYLLNNRKHSKK